MFIFDERITIEDRPVLDPYLNGFDYKTSGLTFTSLFMWRNINDFSWKRIGEYLCIAGISHLELENEEPFLFPPLTRTGTYDPERLRETILAAKEIFEAQGQTFQIRLMPAHMREILVTAFGKEIHFADDRPNYDYVYLKKNLIDLKGRAYSTKRNHLNYFRNHYDFQYEKMRPDMAEEVLSFLRRFNDEKDVSAYEKKLLVLEEETMHDVMKNLDKIGYLSGGIRIDGVLEALAIGGLLGEKSAVVHVEKANTEVRGAYQAINQEFCKNLPAHVKFVNREEDMGISGLRKSKQSYRPIEFIESQIAFFPGGV